MDTDMMTPAASGEAGGGNAGVRGHRNPGGGGSSLCSCGLGSGPLFYLLLSFDPHGKLTKWGLLLCPFYVRKLKFGHLKALSICHPLVNSTAWIRRSANGVLAAVTVCRILISTSHAGDTHCNGFPGGAVLKNLPANAGDVGSIPSSGRSPGGGNGNLLQYSCLEHPMDRRAWWDTIYGVVKSWTRLSD